MCALAKEWLTQRWPVVCVQETWLCPQSQYVAEAALSSTARQMFWAPYTAFWAHCSRAQRQAGEGGEMGEGGASSQEASPGQAASPMASASPASAQLGSQPGLPAPQGRSSAGVGILVDSGLLERGVLQLVGEPQRHASGRFISLRMAWEGHTFTLCCVYLPSGDPVGQRAFMAEHLAPLAAGHQDLVVVGDWNWVPDVGLDRFSRPAPVPDQALLAPPPAEPRGWQRGAGQGWHRDNLTAASFAAACPRLVDVYRRRYPRRAVYTYHDWRAASRLDRFYASSSMVPHVESCGVLSASLSDHRPVFLHLRPKRARTLGRGVSAHVQPRVRLHHCSDRELAAGMAAWLQWQLGVEPDADSQGAGTPPEYAQPPLIPCHLTIRACSTGGPGSSSGWQPRPGRWARGRPRRLQPGRQRWLWRRRLCAPRARVWKLGMRGRCRRWWLRASIMPPLQGMPQLTGPPEPAMSGCTRGSGPAPC